MIPYRGKLVLKNAVRTGGSAPDEVKPDIVKKVCKVCSDNASGNHFGVMTCEACKSFFRRSIRASAKYYCNNHNACIIDKRNRNRCQACRLRKCLDVGMQPDSVQEERAPINRDIYPRMPPYTIPFPPVQMPNNNYHYFMYPSVQQPVSVTTDPLTFVTPQEVVKVEQPSVTPCKTEPPPPYTISSGQRGSNGINGDAMPVRVPVPVQSPQTISYRTFSPPTTIHQQQQQQQLSQQQPSQQQPSQQQQQQAMLPSNTQHRRSAPTISNGVSYANTHSLQQTISAPPRKSVDPHRPHSHSTPIGPSEVDPLPPLSPTSALSDTSSVNSFPSQNVFQPPTTMGPPRQIPHTMAIQLPSCPISSDYPKPHSTPYSPFHQIQHDLSTTQEFTTMSPNPEHNSIMPYREYSPVHTGPLNSPTYPPLTMSNSQIQHDAYHPTVVRRQNSRSSSPTNSLISVGSGPSMGRPGSIISGRLYSVGGGDRNGSVISGDTSHHLRSNHDVESQGNYSFNHYRSRSPSSPTSSYSGSRPGSTRTASSYSGHSRALSHHSDPSRSRTSSISGPLTASIRSAQISGPPNPQHIYITLEQLMQSDKILDVMQYGPGTTGSMPLGDLVEACNLSLKKIVDWAKQIQMIALISNDVLMKLMKNAWGELLCFILAIRYSREPIVQPGSGLNQQGSAYVLQQLVSDLKSWIVERQLTVVELACLKAVILFNADCGLVGLDRQLVEVLQVQILNILKKHCRSIVPVDPTRYGQIMLKFGIIKQIGLEATSEIEVMQVLGAEIHDVLDDLMNRE